MNIFEKDNLDKLYKLSILSALLILGLYYGGNIIFPILFALFFSLSLLGPARKLDSIGVPRFLSAFALVAFSTAAVAALLAFISFEGYKLINTLNEIALTKRLGVIEELGVWITDQTSASLPNEKEAYNTVTKKVVGASGAALNTGYNMLKSTFVFLSLVPIYAVLFLTYRGRVRVFLDNIFEKRNSQHGRQIIEDIASMIQSYLTGLLIVILVVGALYALGLSLIGVKFALLLSLVTAVLIIIPYIGAILGAILPAAIALLTMDEWWYSVVVLAMYIGIQVLEGYVLTPFIIGKNVDLNPLVIIIGMIVLGSIGGVLAIILAIPIIASVKIAFSHVDGLKPFAGLMEQES